MIKKTQKNGDELRILLEEDLRAKMQSTAIATLKKAKNGIKEREKWIIARKDQITSLENSVDIVYMAYEQGDEDLFQQAKNQIDNICAGAKTTNWEYS